MKQSMIDISIEQHNMIEAAVQSMINILVEQAKTLSSSSIYALYIDYAGTT